MSKEQTPPSMVDTKKITMRYCICLNLYLLQTVVTRYKHLCSVRQILTWKSCKCLATRESRECTVNSAAIYLWLCVSPQDENFQGKPVKPLFSINWSLNDSIGFLKKEKEGNTKKIIEEYPF